MLQQEGFVLLQWRNCASVLFPQRWRIDQVIPFGEGQNDNESQRLIGGEF